MRAFDYQPIAGTCPQTEMEDHPVSLGMTCGSLGQGYCCKSATIQIPHDATLAPVRKAGDQSRDRWCEAVTLTNALRWLTNYINEILNIFSILVLQFNESFHIMSNATQLLMNKIILYILNWSNFANGVSSN